LNGQRVPDVPLEEEVVVVEAATGEEDVTAVVSVVVRMATGHVTALMVAVTVEAEEAEGEVVPHLARPRDLLAGAGLDLDLPLVLEALLGNEPALIRGLPLAKMIDANVVKGMKGRIPALQGEAEDPDPDPLGTGMRGMIKMTDLLPRMLRLPSLQRENRPRKETIIKCEVV
jgi:hypothetical protein